MRTCLWFDGRAEEAAAFYTSIFPRSKVTEVSREGASTAKVTGRPVGAVLAVAFELDGRPFLALNGGPGFPFSQAVSLIVECKDQKEIDDYWSKLLRGGEESECGWLKDKFGFSWQVVPAGLLEWITDEDPARSDRVMAAVLTMKKLDLATLERAAKGK